MCFDHRGRPCKSELSINLKYGLKWAARFGLDDRYAVLMDGGRKCAGIAREDLLAYVQKSDIYFNVNGFISFDEILDRAAFRVFLDIDPGFFQVWKAAGWHDGFMGHDAFITLGQNIGSAECSIPSCDLEWIGTGPPVALDHWSDNSDGGQRFTSVVTWRGPWSAIEFEGTTYGLRAHEFRKFSAMPRLVNESFELALDVGEEDQHDVEALTRRGWTIADPRKVAGDPERYRDYLRKSKAEVGVAKHMYVESRSGWFSDRSACYLASGKPVLAQNTAFDNVYPTGQGLLTFSTLEEAVAGVEEINAHYRCHASAARDLASTYFDSRKVLNNLLGRLGVA
jgi:hypothetical protein